MAIKTKILTPAEAGALATVHGELSREIVGNARVELLEDALVSLGVGGIGRLIGPWTGTISGFVTFLLQVSETSNRQADSSYLRGAELAFLEVQTTLLSGGYLAAEVEQNWVTYPSISTEHELVQGNEEDPGAAYRVLRVQAPTGWIEL